MTRRQLQPAPARCHYSSLAPDRRATPVRSSACPSIFAAHVHDRPTRQPDVSLGPARRRAEASRPLASRRPCSPAGSMAAGCAHSPSDNCVAGISRPSAGFTRPEWSGPPRPSTNLVARAPPRPAVLTYHFQAPELARFARVRRFEGEQVVGRVFARSAALEKPANYCR
jgi:hypothetical protein